jgi:hypothetical protein
MVGTGMSLGKFMGGPDKAGIELVLERISYETTFETARAAEHILMVPKLVASPTVLETFTHWHKKEEILGYVDIAAFVGGFFDFTSYFKEANSGSTDYDHIGEYEIKIIDPRLQDCQTCGDEFIDEMETGLCTSCEDEYAYGDK